MTVLKAVNVGLIVFLDNKYPEYLTT